MHTFLTASGRRIHHNSDFSGGVVVQAWPGEVEAYDPATGSAPGFAVTVPFADLLELLDEYLRMRAEEMESPGWELGCGDLAMPPEARALVRRTGSAMEPAPRLLRVEAHRLAREHGCRLSTRDCVNWRLDDESAPETDDGDYPLTFDGVMEVLRTLPEL